MKRAIAAAVLAVSLLGASGILDWDKGHKAVDTEASCHLVYDGGRWSCI
jgi:hypothetical protein